MPSPLDPTAPASDDDDLDVRGALPLGLAGHLVAMGRDGLVHSLHFGGGRVSYVARTVRAGPAVTELVAFEGTVLAHGEDSSVFQLMPGAGAVRRVDLAGQRRAVVACPRHDPISGELHLLADDPGGAQAHVVVPAGALTRRSRLIIGARGRVEGLAVGGDHLVFLAAGAAGVAPREGDARTTWLPTGTAAPWPIGSHRVGDAIVLLALTPSLERWILRPASGAIEREVLDPTPRRFARLGDDGVEGPPRWLWTTGGDTIGHHDLAGSHHAHHSLRPHRPGDFVVVPDDAHPSHAGHGWLLGLVHDAATATTGVRVSGAADIDEAAATVVLPRPVPPGLRCAWVPATPP